MSNKLNILILCGGQSAEHEISLLSAQNIVSAIDKNKFDIQVVAIDKNGSWYMLDKENLFLNSDDPKNITFKKENEVFLAPSFCKGQLIPIDTYKPLNKIDAVIPVLHGPNGEDGSIQGFFQIANIPVVGCGVLSSSMCMDKDIAKKILLNDGIAVCSHLIARRGSDNNPSFERASTELGHVLFIKPANMGSSVGVSKVTNKAEYDQALIEAFKYDKKVLIEEAVTARELEVALLGNNDVKASVVGEVAPKDGFYSFDAKYIESDSAQLIVPAQVSDEVSDKLRSTAIQAYRALECQGLARCDFFYTDDNKILINEINTFPGFTNISQYPMLWKESGINSTELITQLIELALEK